MDNSKSYGCNFMKFWKSIDYESTDEILEVIWNIFRIFWLFSAPFPVAF